MTIKNEFNSKEYWENRYKSNGNSGSGSYGILCDFKASIINDFILNNNIESVVEFGCGDGNQLSKIICNKYVGYDVSEYIINKNIKTFQTDFTKRFYLYDKYNNEKYDLSLSLDVIFHLVEDDIFNEYMDKLFKSSNKYVIIYSSNGDIPMMFSEHLFDRKFTDWIEKNINNFKLIKKIENTYKYNINKKDEINTSISDFYFYEKIN
jgi:SAM-dependent methyltransferase